MVDTAELQKKFDEFFENTTEQDFNEWLTKKMVTEKTAQAYIIYNTNKVNSILTICLRTLSGNEMEVLRDSLSERLPKK